MRRLDTLPTPAVAIGSRIASGISVAQTAATAWADRLDIGDVMDVSVSKGPTKTGVATLSASANASFRI